ncbi:MAG: 30S ribosomal protein S20 [Oscillospiraceae bacterium]|jgi:small subunit ribosomal protein S20|nr:30S ribosomal protein S20 [Oscillospiraceae bacterium]MCI9363485.1 30S ribosomal protein S20 [Oscillospiraceae bacterium]MCI9668860.1 30S ribosomal protein S20 [Oscillospiraceae bacterium]RKJ59104.1 30S ribosomal protein S20 [bacterium 1XD42-8]RKJ67290.1 30S ribosomal protein S20 [bacterium 1XD42-1]
MPNIKSAKKRVLVAKKKAAQNKAARSALKTVLKKANTGDPAAVKVAIKKVDQAVASHILHKNNAAHKKSALMKKLAASAN